MRFRTWPVAALGLVGLLALIAASLSTAYERARSTSGQLEALNQGHRATFNKLRQVRTDIYLSAIYVRDYLLDHERARDPEYQARLAAFRESSRRALADLEPMLPARPDGSVATAPLQASLEEYWRLFEPLFFRTSADKAARSASFVRTEVLHRREEALALARDIEALNDQGFETQRAEIVRRRTEYQEGLQRLMWQTLVIGLLVSAVAVNRLRVLERRADEQRLFTEDAERRMRQLSQQIVATQEEERRKLSRELHDHVGQLLTGLRLALGRIERNAIQPIGIQVADARDIVDDLTRLVRDLASGLWPSMLDDLGLQPALEWLARDVSRRSGLPVAVHIDGTLDGLPDAHRTCLYRVVQEALTNVVRHARASRADVTVRRRTAGVALLVRDDGVGSQAEHRADGLGLRGIEERVKELAGSVRVETAPGRGTTVQVNLPVGASVVEVPQAEESRARLAG